MAAKIKFLIDTNVFIKLEDHGEVPPDFSEMLSLAAKYEVAIFVHEAAVDDIKRDKDPVRQKISLSKIEKFQAVDKVRGLGKENLEKIFGPLSKENDVVDMTLLHSIEAGAVDFLITQDNGIHKKARLHSSELADRVFYVADALAWLKSTFVPVDVDFPYVEEVQANSIPLDDDMFDSLREGYPDFDNWWKLKCIAEHRPCWIVSIQGELGGIVVRKDESKDETDAKSPGNKFLKVCTFKTKKRFRGGKIGELLLKQIFWFAQRNRYDCVYLTVYPEQGSLISLIEFFGFEKSSEKDDGELIYEKLFSNEPLESKPDDDLFDLTRKNYPRFPTSSIVPAYGIPIKGEYHDVLFPELVDRTQGNLFEDLPGDLHGVDQRTPGNTIRKVYICKAPAKMGEHGAFLFFYRSKSDGNQSQCLTTIGFLESAILATSTQQLMQMVGKRSVYSQKQLHEWNATAEGPVKVINFLLLSHIEPSISLVEMQDLGIVGAHPFQSVTSFDAEKVRVILERTNLDFRLSDE